MTRRHELPGLLTLVAALCLFFMLFLASSLILSQKISDIKEWTSLRIHLLMGVFLED